VGISIAQGEGRNQHVEHRVGPEADLAAGQPDDAGVSGPEHLDANAVAEAELAEALDVVGVAGDAVDLGGLPGLQLAERDGGSGGMGTGKREVWHGVGKAQSMD
jgi:hypothetical protein